MKKCFKCSQWKERKYFYKHKQMGDGLLGKCKACTKRDVRVRYGSEEGKEKIKAYEKLRSKLPERRAKAAVYGRRHELRYPGKYKARTKAYNAIRDGRLVRGKCELCGSVEVEAHHTDYRKALDVRWLCGTHHDQADKGLI